MLKIFKFEMLQRVTLPQEFSQGGEPSVQAVIIGRNEIAGREPNYVLQYTSIITVCEDGSLPPHAVTLSESKLFAAQPTAAPSDIESSPRKRR